MEKLTLDLPGGKTINPIPIPGQGSLKPEFKDIGSLISSFLNIVFYIAIFLAFYWLVWGAFQYILAQGKKEELAKARARITWALVGLIIVLSAFLIAKFALEIFPPTSGKGGLPF